MLEPREPRISLSLNGTWDLAPGEGDAPPAAWRHTVPVPSLVDAAVPPYDWKAARYHWYRARFRMPAGVRRDTVLLVLEQAMFGTQVWLNGTCLGGDIGCYTSQEYLLGSALDGTGDNELLVRVGARDTLPPESAVGRDQERISFIPGIWGDARVVGTGRCRVSLVQVVPRIGSGTAEVRVTVRNEGKTPARLRIAALIADWKTHTPASRAAIVNRTVAAGAAVSVRFLLRIPDFRLWHPDDPFLYEAIVSVNEGDGPLDSCSARFGMREFAVRGGDFLLNGKQIYLRGGNIAFHRFLSSSDRGTLPWQPGWIRKVLIDIPRAHNLNFFRNHLGQMYNRWYDIADEHGMLLQNEWQFWTVSGTRRQIRKEFTRWVQDNWNHPSIIIWDPINESTDRTVQKVIVPAMKKLDPTRPWESVDFVEQHPYIYSLGPVLIDRRLGFSESLLDLERMRKPSMVNEFLWWWLDRDARPTPLTREVVERWLGPEYAKEDLLAHQAFLAQELVELFRRLRIDAIQPFVYLSSNEGPTSHWFLGDIAQLRPKPILEALRLSFAPLGVSLELWDRHFLPGEVRTISLYLFNDADRAQRATVSFGIRSADHWLTRQHVRFSIGPVSTAVRRVRVRFPRTPGAYLLQAEIADGEDSAVARSSKPVHVLPAPVCDDHVRGVRAGVLDYAREHARFLIRHGVRACDLRNAGPAGMDVCLVTGEAAWGRHFSDMRRELGRWVDGGGTLLLIEPERTIETRAVLHAVPGMRFVIERRPDTDRGGYDSHVFAEDIRHPIWRGLLPSHLRFFNGGFGGEIVSQHTVVPQTEHVVLARCGLRLAVIAAAEIPYGRGRVMLWRLQTRGRLAPQGAASTLYARRQDAVAQQLMFNLLSYALGNRA